MKEKKNEKIKYLKTSGKEKRMNELKNWNK